jgi:multicomponent Na+:H+ antiporter subunit B
MYSSLLSISARYLSQLLFVLSLVVLYRGHNLPGGGFIGGLIAASAVLLIALARNWDDALAFLRFSPLNIIVTGLSIAVLSGIPGLIQNGAYLTGEWLPFFELPLLGKIKLGTPLLFDIGVYLAVVGSTIKCAHSLGMDIEESA